MKTFRKGLLSVFLGLCIMLTAPCILPNLTNLQTVEAAGKAALNKTKATLQKGQKFQLKLNGAKRKVSWTTSDAAIASVSPKGLVTAKKAGSVSITAKVGKKKFVCKITVEAPSISAKTLYITKGKKYTLKVKGTKQKVTWQTSDQSIAGVSAKGVVTAKKVGTANVTAKVGSKKYVCRVTVETPALSQKTASVAPGKKITLTMNGTRRKVTWSTSNASVASVSSSGIVTGKKAGTATITAKVGVIKYTCKVTVKNSRAFSVSSKSVRIPVNGQKKITVYSPGKSKLSYKIIGDKTLVKCKWGSWDKSNRRPFIITGAGTGKLTIEITENATKKKQKISVEVYGTGSEPDISAAMSSEAEADTYLMGIKFINHGSKPLRLFSEGAQSIDASDSSYNRDLWLADLSADGNDLELYEWVEIRPNSSAIVFFYTEQSTRYNRKTSIVYKFSYDGKNYVACSNYSGSEYY